MPKLGEFEGDLGSTKPRIIDPRLEACVTPATTAGTTDGTSTRPTSENAPSQVRAYEKANGTGGTGSRGVDQKTSDSAPLGSILDDAEKLLRRWITYTHEAHYVTNALWVAATHLIDESNYAPPLVLNAPRMNSGKTTVQDITRMMSRDSLAASNVTGAALFRLIDAKHPTIFIDEADNSNLDAEGGEVFRAVMTSGFKRGASSNFIRSVQGKGDFVPKVYNVFGLVCIAGNGKFAPETVLSRGFVIPLLPRTAAEEAVAEEFDEEYHEGLLDEVRGRFDTFVAAMEPGTVRGREVECTVGGRNAQKWRFLLRIADLAGGEWPRRTREAAEYLCGVGKESKEYANEATLLLRDLRTVFVYLLATDDPQNPDAKLREGIPTRTLLSYLHQPDHPDFTRPLVNSKGELVELPPVDPCWASKSDELDDNRLTRIMRESFAIHSSKKRNMYPDGKQLRGYAVADLVDLFGRFL